MTVQGTSIPIRTSVTIDPPNEDKFEDPPPYSIVITSTNVQERNAQVSSEQHVPPATSSKKDDAVASATSALASVSLTCPQPRWFLLLIKLVLQKMIGLRKMPNRIKDGRKNEWVVLLTIGIFHPWKRLLPWRYHSWRASAKESYRSGFVRSNSAFTVDERIATSIWLKKNFSGLFVFSTRTFLF